MTVDQLIATRIRQLPQERRAEVLDFVEFLLSRTPALSTGDPWASLRNSLAHFSDDFMEVRDQPPHQLREGLFDE